MKLYLVHCGFYDEDICDAIYESHVNLFVAAKTFEEAKQKVRLDDTFKKKKMHVDGLQEISQVGGYDIALHASSKSQGDVIVSNPHRDL